MFDFETSKSNYEVSQSNSNILLENYFFLENNVTDQMEPFFTMFYTINSF